MQDLSPMQSGRTRAFSSGVSNSFGHDRDFMRLIRALFNFIELHGSSFYPQGLGLMMVTAEVARLFPRAAQSYKAGVDSCCHLGCEISPRCNRVVQGPYFYGVYNSFGHGRDFMRLIRADASRYETMRKRIELHGSFFYPQELGVTLVAAEDARLFPREAQPYRGLSY
jgi:hypothetical protein